MKHYRYGGSTADRTIGCPAWHGLADQMPERQTSSYAEEGTALHECMDAMLNRKGDPDPQAFLGTTFNDHIMTEDRIENKIVPALDAFIDLCLEYGLEDFLVENTMVMPDDDEIGGTADVIATGNGYVAVVDWKFGEGVQVHPKGLGQGLFYSMLAAETPSLDKMFKGADKLLVVIIQPNSRGEDTLRVWEGPLDASLNTFYDDYFDAVDKSRAGKSKPAAGKWCKFCPALATCPTKTGLAAKAKRMDKVTAKNVSKALLLANEVEDWIKGVRTFAHEQLEQGVPVAGFKLVNKRAMLKWSDVEQAANVMTLIRKLKKGDCYTKPALISAPQMVKLCKKQGVDFSAFDDYTSKTSSGTTLAPEDDPREAYVSVEGLKALKDRLS